MNTIILFRILSKTISTQFWVPAIRTCTKKGEKNMVKQLLWQKNGPLFGEVKNEKMFYSPKHLKFGPSSRLEFLNFFLSSSDDESLRAWKQIEFSIIYAFFVISGRIRKILRLTERLQLEFFPLDSCFQLRLKCKNSIYVFFSR